jgi:Zn-dependent M28 family amino/carboxypeptidase
VKRPPGRFRSVTATLAATAIAAPLLLASTSTATASPQPSQSEQTTLHHSGEQLARKLVKNTNARSAYKHLKAFQRIADRNGGKRASGTPGYDASAAYAYWQFKKAGYDVHYQRFEFDYRESLAERLVQLTPEQRDIEMLLMTHTPASPEGGTEAELALVTGDPETGSGCLPEDFADGDYEGKIALIERGICAFALKAANAAEAGAIGAVVYNNAEGLIRGGTLGSPESGTIPTGGISQADGQELAAALRAGDEIRVDLEIRELAERRWTSNVIAETPGGDPSNVVMVGAHLDSVQAGPGINDNGSGSAGVLETAQEFADAAKIDRRGWAKHQNKMRFVLWGAEELGLLGAHHYVDELTDEERDAIALYLNFDMIASPNYGMFVYDGDGSENISDPGPDGSAQIEHTINSFMEGRGYQPRPTAFSGRSDYGPFIEVGIPAGGTFTGAEGVKTEAQAELWGGTAGEWYDSCYHQDCDDLSNISMRAFDANVKTIAHLVGTYAWSTASLDTPVPAGEPVDPETADSGGLHEHGHEVDH